MKRGDQHGGAVRVHAPAQLPDRLARAEQALGRDAPERQHDLGLQHRELRRQEGRAGGELVSFRIAIGGRPALHGVGDVDLVAGQLDFARLEHLGEELPRAPDERQALRVLVGAGALADHDQLGARVARAEDDRGATLAELALATALERRLLGPERLGGPQ